MNKPQAAGPRKGELWLVLLAAGGAFALTMGVRQTMGLFCRRSTLRPRWVLAASASLLPLASSGGA
ncbi:hypothetical protein LP416_04405 [Polaromonas sp. P2-4]|nr:hypothetical protein LP416_04405 [Polaromonas sp. P2-4]